MIYRLLIVDDENWIRERLRCTIDWGSLGVEVIGEACDGEEALKMTGLHSPDIIITDIRMPCIDGLEYIKRLRDDKNPAKVIIISGYSDFEYARKAVKLGAFDYILKPIEDEVLIDVVERCVYEINAEKEKDILFKKAKKQLKESRQILRKEFLSNLVNGSCGSEQEIRREMDYLGLKPGGSNCICFIAELDQFHNSPENSEWDRHLLQFVMCNIAGDFLNRLGSGEFFFPEHGRAVCLVFSEADEKNLTRQVLSVTNAIRKMVKRVTGQSVTIGIGRVCSSLKAVSVSYGEAGEALQYKIYLGMDRIYDINSIGVQYRPGSRKIYDLELLLNNIKVGNRENAVHAINNMVKLLKGENSYISPMELKLIYMDTINSIMKSGLDTNTSSDDFSSISFKFLEQLNKLQTMEELNKWLTEIVISIMDILDKNKSSRKRKVIEKALDYINSHYTEPITLNSVAEDLFMNASYFCKIFREEQGDSFTKYLMNLRIQKAKELLSDPTMKIYEIASLVGYDDVQYFTRVFKSIEGVTPVQYREKIQ